MSMISELVDRLRTESKSMGKYGTDYMATLLMQASDTIIMLSEKARADRPQGWIPCSERLPSNFSEDETVLATTDVDGDRVIAMFALDVKSFYLKGYVTAWMPLPKPWKGADDE